MSTQTLFISDLHLSADVPKLTQLFLDSLNQWQGKIDALYILGDFFDVWVGDDDENEFTNKIIKSLSQFSKVTPVFFQHGNRDFLLGKVFAQKSGIKILPEQFVIECYGKKLLLTHGDEMCTDDIPYQQFRMQSRNPLWQSAVLMKPLAERKMLAGQIRAMSETKKNQDGISKISDVTEVGVQTILSKFGDEHVDAIIHGHTHRPDMHEHSCNGTLIKRFVLQDWEINKGGYLSIDQDGVITTHKLMIE